MNRLILDTNKPVHRAEFGISKGICLAVAFLCFLVGIGGLVCAAVGFNSTAEVMQEGEQIATGLTMLFMFANLAVSVLFFALGAILNWLVWN